MSGRQEYLGEQIWERLVQTSGPLTDARQYDDAALRAAIGELRVVCLEWASDGYAGKYIWLTVIAGSDHDLATIRYGVAHGRRWQTVVFARPLQLSDAERAALADWSAFSWEHLAEIPDLPENETRAHP
ncbi:MAG: hypothetical protein HC822_17895 [Oscillochloris sp.]|nr:hypothetical protein [Oscillochloris sp.]